MQTVNENFDLMEILTDDNYLEPFDIPKEIPEDAKKVYSYTKLCGKNPYISIIGSFSVGKSSFVNTLSEKEIVPYDTSKTTSVPMLIAKDDDRIIINTFFSKIVNLKIDYLDSIIDQVRHNPDIDYRRYIDFIVLNYKEFPYENTTLVDTPGYSGGDKDYEISKSMINVSDAVIFLFDASKGSLTDEDLDILEYAKSQKADIFVVANKIDKVWEDRQEILDLAIKSLKDRNIDIGRNICYFSNDSDYEKQIKLEFQLIKSFITKVSQKEYFKLAEWSVGYWNKKGIALYNLKRYEEALQCYDKAIQLEPNSTEYWSNKGLAFFKLSRYDEALPCFDKATQLEPNNAEYWSNKGLAFFKLSRYDEALTCFDKATQLEPNNAGYWNMKGNTYLSRSGSFKRSNELQSHGLFSSIISFLLFSDSFKLHQIDEAIQCYDKATQLEPNNAGYWDNKGWALYNLKRYDEALQCYDKAIELEPNNAVYWDNKGVALYDLKRYNEALTCFDKATQLEPNNAGYWVKKGVLLDKLSRYDEALTCFDKATQLEPNNAVYWDNKGVALYDLKRYNEALTCFDKATQLEPNNAVYWDKKGVLLDKLSRYDEALTCFDKATQLEPNNAGYWNMKGNILEYLKRSDEAKKCKQKAKELGYNG